MVHGSMHINLCPYSFYGRGEEGAYTDVRERGRGAHTAVVTIPMRTPSYLLIDLFVHLHHVLNETFAVVTGSGGVCECSECGYSVAASKRCNVKTKKAVQYE